LLEYERQAWSAGYQRVAGVDEAGRGPLAGPVVAGAVVFDPEFLRRETEASLKGLTDSKKLSEKRREHFFELFHELPHVSFATGMAEVEEIDSLNILRATHIAMARALSALKPLPAMALVDGLPVPNLPCASTAIVGGDHLSFSIAAASIIAKVTRDRMMVEFDNVFPGYGFAKHKGYGTREHMAALKKLGPCPIHRRSFSPVSQMELF